MFFFKKRKPKIFIIGLDGVPYSFLKENIENKNLPFLSNLFKNGSFLQMESVYPTLSSVAWTSFLTGARPGTHGIYGFIDVKNDLSIFIPNYNDIKIKTILEILVENNKKILHINLPITYPPPRLNGTCCISGFLSPSIEKGVYPEELSEYLKKENYIIDLDPWMARNKEKRGEFYKNLFRATEKRFRVCEFLIKKNEFDIIILHIMEPDRLLHFFINEKEKLKEYFKFLDNKLENFIEKNVSDKDELVLLSDHGFTQLKKEINVLAIFKKEKIIKFEKEKPDGIKDITPDSKAFTLTPGRIYLFTNERFEKAKFKSKEVEKEVKGILNEVLKIEGVKDCKKREEIFGIEPTPFSPDFLLIPENGYDLKGDLKSDEIFSRSALEGTHTYDDAFLFIRGRKIKKEKPSILDLAPTILEISKIKNNYKFDGEVLI